MVASEPRVSNQDAPAYRDLLLSMQDEMEAEESLDAGTPAPTGALASILAQLKQRQKATTIVVGSVAVLAILATATRVGTQPEQAPLGFEASLVTPGSTNAAAAVAASTGSTVSQRDAAAGPATAAAAATPVTASRIRLADQRPAAKKSSDSRPDQPRIAIPKVSSALTAGFDSVVRARAGSARADNDPFSLQAAGPTPQRLTFDRDDQTNPRTRAQLIGALPTPRYPAQLAGVEGELTARFEVDAAGKPVMSTVSVVNSPHELLTAAVLKVLPGIRFEPARSGGADSKAVSDVVQLTFRFQAGR